MHSITFSERLPTPEEWRRLRTTTDWGERTEDERKLALAGTLFGLCAFDGDDIVAMARIIGDGSLCFLIQDVIVHTDYRGKGIGSELVRRLLEEVARIASPDATIYLFASKGNEGFYKAFGFKERPSESGGAGMLLEVSEITGPNRCTS